MPTNCSPRPILQRPLQTLAAVLFTLGVGVAIAQEPPAATEVRELFEAGWKPSVKGLESAQGHYEKAKQLAASDVRVPFAMSLVYMKNSKLPAASTELDAALAGAKTPLLPIRRARIYLAAVQKDYPATDREMKALANSLSGEPLSGDAEMAYVDSAKFLGTLVEFLAMQGDTTIRADAVASLDKLIQASLKPDRLSAYTAARAETAKRRTDLETEVTSEKSEALDENTKKREEALAKIEAPVSAAQAQAAGAVEQEKKHREANESERARHEPMARQALAQLQTIDRNIDGVQSRIRNLKSDIDRIKRENEKGKKDKPPKKERDFKREEQELRQEENKLGNLQQDKAKLEGNPSVAFMRNYNARLQQLAGAISAANQNLVVVKKKADNLRNNLNRTKVTDSSTKTTTLGNEIKALRTYVQLDLDEEKERILASYRPK